MTTVAVLGGGQLGRMLGLAGIPLGLTFRFLDPSPDAPAAAVGELVVGALDDPAALDEVTRGADVVTYEWEGVPADSARHAARTAAVRPGDRSLEVAQDRLVEKETFRRLGIAVPEFAPVTADDDLGAAIQAVGGHPVVVKTRRGGYDGKGQVVLRSPADRAAASDLLTSGQPLIVEQLVPFTRELSVLVVRGNDGTVLTWPLVENLHADGILRTSIAPAPGVTPALAAEAEKIAERLVTDLDHVGVLAIELFEHDGRLLANEIAPRVHNSGHWTIEGAETSQFENHLRAVLGWSLGSTAPRGNSVMVNYIGTMPTADEILAIPGAHVHDYGKAPRPGRKLGHVTSVAATADERDARRAELETMVERA